MTLAPFKQVDVFTARPYNGNPVAVILAADGLTTEDMQRIARWTNLSETTFVLRSEVASYRLRIFTPASELPFAGHPTLGSAHAVLEAGLAQPAEGMLTQECLAGVIPIRVAADGRLSARVPAPKVLREHGVSATAVADMLGVPVLFAPAPTPVDLGPVWLVALLPSVEALAEARPDYPAIAAFSREHGLTGLTAFAIDATARGGAEAPRVQLRSFAPAIGIEEDPVCGSCNAAVGAFLGATGLLAQTGRSYVAAQGMQLGRAGRVAVEVRAPDHIEIGGQAVTVIDGSIRLD